MDHQAPRPIAANRYEAGAFRYYPYVMAAFVAILLGGLTGIAPERRSEAARLGLRSILAGSLATFMTGCVAGMFIGG